MHHKFFFHSNTFVVWWSVSGCKKGNYNSESLQIEKRKEKINNGSNEVGEIGIDRSNEK